MTREFEGKTEEEAINKAIEELHIEREDFDVEVIDNGKRGLFKKSNVKIRVRVDSCFDDEEMPFGAYSGEEEEEEEPQLEVNEEIEKQVCSFLEQTVSYMGYNAVVSVTKRSGRKVFISMESEDSNIIIGRNGRNLDALQVLANVYTGNFDARYRMVVDCEGYRIKTEERIVKEALKAAAQVKKTGRSYLFSPMNPYERRLIHKALNDVTGIETKSEGEGKFRQVRVISRRKYR